MLGKTLSFELSLFQSSSRKQEWEPQPVRRTWLSAGHKHRHQVLPCDMRTPAPPVCSRPHKKATDFSYQSAQNDVSHIHIWGFSVSFSLYTLLGNIKYFRHKAYTQRAYCLIDENISLDVSLVKTSIFFLPISIYLMRVEWANDPRVKAFL